MGDWWMLLVLAFVGLLIFGKRLPEVGKNMGRGIVEFKKGLSGIEDQINPNTPSQPQARVENTASSRQIADQSNASTSASSESEMAAMREEMRRMREELNTAQAKLSENNPKT
ncbi:MAG: twin-arginine translocase TatA/TatE family subunit [Phycisphaeraceae bacterium]|nr:twin-arginine translocase TatA/TatE family subunit [Phycisphaeraceae bacterium]